MNINSIYDIRDFEPVKSNENGNGRWESFWKWLVGLTLAILFSVLGFSTAGYVKSVDTRLETIEELVKVGNDISLTNKVVNDIQDKRLDDIDREMTQHIKEDIR